MQATISNLNQFAGFYLCLHDDETMGIIISRRKMNPDDLSEIIILQNHLEKYGKGDATEFMRFNSLRAAREAAIRWGWRVNYVIADGIELNHAYIEDEKDV